MAVPLAVRYEIEDLLAEYAAVLEPSSYSGHFSVTRMIRRR